MKAVKTLLLVAATLLAPSFAVAQAWMQLTNAPNTIHGITVSADGSKLAATDRNWPSIIWVSTNSGINWTSNNIPGVPVSGEIEQIAMSASGDKMAAVALFASAIFTSTNYGATWISNSVPAEPWFRIASSSDGTKLAALGGYSIGPCPIYVSADSGQTWTQANAPVTNWVAVACSANGSNWVATAETPSPVGGTIYSSTNSGFDWTLIAGGTNLVFSGCMVSSADGTKLLATAGTPAGEGIYTSTNSGATWSSNAVPNEAWIGAASSADGRTLAAVAIWGQYYPSAGDIYTSTNSGTTWISNNVPSQNWAGITSSADGGTLLAAGFGSGIGVYISQTVNAPDLNILPANGNLALSWIIPSTNFILQQSADLTSWADVTNPPVLNLANLQNQVTLTPSNSSGFYWLKTP